MLIVEDGSIVAGAEVFASIAYADTYHAARGNTTWTDAITADKESAQRKGNAFIINKYRLRWKGTRKTIGQSQPFPRTGIYDEDGYLLPDNEIPVALKNAECEAALRALSADLQPDLVRGGAVKRKKVGPIDVEYFGSAAAETLRPAVDRLLLGLIRSRNELVRA